MRSAYCFDLDGTVTREEILPVISKEVGLYEEIGALTEATIKGVIPFRKSFLLRCRLLNGVPLTRIREIIASIALHDGIERFMKERTDQCFIVTGNLDVWVQPLIDRLGCQSFSSFAEVDDDRITNVRAVLNKGEAIKEIRGKFDRIVAVGDGMGDVPMFEKADVRIAFGGVHDPIQTLIQLSDYITYEEESLCRLLNTL